MTTNHVAELPRLGKAIEIMALDCGLIDKSTPVEAVQIRVFKSLGAAFTPWQLTECEQQLARIDDYDLDQYCIGEPGAQEKIKPMGLTELTDRVIAFAFEVL
jgi:hypothetical protein